MNTIIIDTREPHEYNQSHVEGSINIPPQVFMQDKLPDALVDADKATEIILYCRSGMRSNTVGHMLRAKGFTNIVNGVNENHVRKLLSQR